ncbi:hypothetical protein Y888_07365 [Mixta calida B021323]|uniref:hypothetical protein n=1 Tax=Mixta calida TaxID=665913 RepID=UPI00133176CD|nr:hypothetical protein [Mixta calida]KAF0860242.1 hypothetical protein Y888_07365 [Mixta calida B021323]
MENNSIETVGKIKEAFPTIEKILESVKAKQEVLNAQLKKMKDNEYIQNLQKLSDNGNFSAFKEMAKLQYQRSLLEEELQSFYEEVADLERGLFELKAETEGLKCKPNA